MENKPAKLFEFSTLSKWLHWGGMVLTLALLIAGTTMVGLDDEEAQKMAVYRVHGIIGLLILLTTIARIIIRVRRPQPVPEGMTEKWNIWLHDIIQWAIYVVLLAIGLSGMGSLALNSMTAFSVEPAGLDRTFPTFQGHFVLTRLYILLIFLHVAGVLRHQLTRSNVLRRMGLNLPIGKA